MSRQPTPDPKPNADLERTPSLEPNPHDSIGQRFNRRLAEDLLEAAFAAAGHAAGRPRSVGVVQIGAPDGRDVGPWLARLAPDVTLRIRQTLPRDARLVFANGARFVMALPGDPLLAALLIVDRVRDALERETWRIDGDRVDLVFDAGVATQRGADEPLAATLEAAQRSLAQSHRLEIRHHAEPDAGSDAHRGAERRRPSGAWSRALRADR